MSPVDWARTLAACSRWMNERLYVCCAGRSDAERKRDRGAFFRFIYGTLWIASLGPADFEGMLRYTSFVNPAMLPDLQPKS